MLTAQQVIAELKQAVEWAEAISQMDSKTAQWVAKDALRELRAKASTLK